jgi:putative inorganic carbon (hco3(-)) transporter
MSTSQTQARSIAVAGRSELILAEFALITGIVLAVLAFGGTEPTSFAAVEILFAGTAAVLFAPWSRGQLAAAFSRRSLWVPALVVALVLLQLCPLPVVSATHINTEALPGDTSNFTHLTIEAFATRAQLLIFLSCILAFVLTQIVCHDPSRRRHLVVAFAGLAIFEAFYGLIQYLTGWQTIFGYVKRYDLQEATGTYINRNHYAGFLEMIFPFTIALALRELRKLQRKTHPFRWRTALATSGLQTLMLWLSISIVLFAAVVFSRSRMGILCLCISLVLTAGLYSTSRLNRKAGLLLCAAFLVVSMAVTVWVGLGSVLNRFQTVGQEYASQDYSRLSIWRDALTLIGQHPWVGTGFGTFPIAYTAVQTSFLGQFVNHAHDDYLELASDLGIPAALALVGSFVWVLARAVWISRAKTENLDRHLAVACAGSILAILLHSFADFNLYIPANGILFASILGLTKSLQPARPQPLAYSR